MASGCLIIGRCPSDLSDLFGRNPVIEVDWTDPLGQVLDILNTIAQYQDLADRNRAATRQFGDWEGRVRAMREVQQA
jgi:hypothetical protein